MTEFLDAVMTLLVVWAFCVSLGICWIDHYFRRKREFINYCMTTRPQERSQSDG